MMNNRFGRIRETIVPKPAGSTTPSKDVNLPTPPPITRSQPAIPAGVEEMKEQKISIKPDSNGNPNIEVKMQGGAVAPRQESPKTPYKPDFQRISEVLGRNAPKPPKTTVKKPGVPGSPMV